MTSALQNGLPASEKSRRASERIGNWAGGGRRRTPPTRAQQANCGSGACGEGRSEPRGSGKCRGVPERAERRGRVPEGDAGRRGGGGGGCGAFVPPLSSGGGALGHCLTPPPWPASDTKKNTRLHWESVKMSVRHGGSQGFCPLLLSPRCCGYRAPRTGDRFFNLNPQARLKAAASLVLHY